MTLVFSLSNWKVVSIYEAREDGGKNRFGEKFTFVLGVKLRLSLSY